MSQFYCALADRDSKIPFFGTAPNHKGLLLIEYPFPFPKSLQESKLPIQVKEHLRGTFENEGDRILLIKNRSTQQMNKRVFYIKYSSAKPIVRRYEIQDYTDLLDLSPELESWQESWYEDRSMYLVCTNGKKDKCCSKFGLPTYKELSKMANLAFQCSHVGGDRFAPNVVLLPHGIYYAHIETQDVATLLEFDLRGEIYLEKYRGRVSFSHAEQAAEYFLRNALGDKQYESITPIESRQDGLLWSTTMRVKRNGRAYLVEFEDLKPEYSTFLTCSAETKKSPWYFKLNNIIGLD